MLPRGSKRRKQDAVNLKESQQRLDAHLRERDAAIPYSDTVLLRMTSVLCVITSSQSGVTRPKRVYVQLSRRRIRSWYVCDV